VAGNMGVIPPAPDYLEGLRDLTRANGAMLIFDEVMTGFRVALGGAQERYGVTPDITALGKVIGGGLPVGAYGASGALMDQISPVGPIYQAGTLSGNPLATAAGLATLEVLEQPGVFDAIENRLQLLCKELGSMANESGIPVFQTQVGSMACTFFNDGQVTNYAQATQSDTARYGKFFWTMLENGVYLAPSQYEAMFMSSVHDDKAIDRTLDAARKAFGALA
jgi:glutamate-1-semialdehyde 2,1-aminomutase